MFRLKSFFLGMYYSLFLFFCFCGGGLFFRFKNQFSNKANVILIPGLLVNRLSMYPMAAFLSRLGYNVYCPALGWNIWGIDRQAQKVEQFMQKQRIDQSLPLYVIGHSMGGLIAHYWLNHSQVKVDKIITLGTPFLGSKAIYYGPWYFFPAAHWIYPQTTIPSYLAQNISQINIGSDDDALVPLSSSLPMDVFSSKILLSKIGGHSALQLSKKTFRKIIEQF